MAVMTAEVRAAPTPIPAAARRERLLGVDVARALAQLGMLITHYTYFESTGGDWRGVTRFLNGKAMPLFVFLGGLGFTMLTRAVAHPVAQALARGAVLFALGLFLVEHAPLIAVILQFYGVFFVLGLLVRRLRGWLLVLAGVMVVVGGLSWLHLAPEWVRYGGWQGWETVRDVRPLFIDLFVSGSYPALPTFAFFLVGMWVGRLALARREVQVRLLVAGLVLALIGFVGGEVVTRATTDRAVLEERGDGALGLTSATEAAITTRLRSTDESLRGRVDDAVDRRGESRRDALRAVVREHERVSGDIPLARLADPVGHGKMPAWVIGAAGWSLAILGASLLATSRWPRALRPIAMAGQLALTFYVLQALGLRWWYADGLSDHFGYQGQLLVCLGLFAAFVVLATLWRRFFARGPLEDVLRWSGLVASAAAARLMPRPSH